jgi:chromosomal replication initiator protein
MSARQSSDLPTSFKPSVVRCPTCGQPLVGRDCLVSEIQTAVAEFYGLELAALIGPSKRRHHARPRQIAMYLSREFTRFTIAKIGRIFDRDQSTASHDISRIEWLVEHDDEVRADVWELRRRLAGEG